MADLGRHGQRYSGVAMLAPTLVHPLHAAAGARALVSRIFVMLVLAAWAAGCASVPAQQPRPASQALPDPQATALGRLFDTRRAEARPRSESAFSLLDSVDAAFASRVALIDGAQKTLDLQYYAIHADSSTEVLLEHARAAARRGVRVRILLDDFNTVGDDAQVLRMAFEPGVELRLFNPLAGPRSSLFGRIFGSLGKVDRIQKRMHNKLFIADNAWGIAGGRNLGDAYFGGDEKSAFVDLDVLAGGPVVRQMSASFDRYWNDELAYPVQTLLSRKELQELQDRSEQAKRQEAERAAGDTSSAAPAPTKVAMRSSQVLPDVTSAQVAAAQRPPFDLAKVPLTWAPGTVLVDEPGKIGPGDDEADAGDTVVDGLLQLMQGAKREVVIVSPYFVPGADMMRQLADLRKRGVAIRVLTNSLASNDAPAAHAGYRRYRRELVAIGVELHEMRSDPDTAGIPAGRRQGAGLSLGSGVGGSKSGISRASLHSKAVMIDRRLAIIGSMNLDLRSQRKNSEVALLIRSGPLAEQAVRLVEGQFQSNSYLVQLEGSGLRWQAPPGAVYKDTTSEPEADLKLRLLVDVLAPFAPEAML